MRYVSRRAGLAPALSSLQCRGTTDRAHFVAPASSRRFPFSGPKTMLNKKLNGKLLWIQIEDVLAPRLRLTVTDRAVYYYLLRHTLVVGKPRLQFAIFSLARTLGISAGRTRQSVRRLEELEALRVLERGKTGHLVEMCLPEKIRAIRP